MLIFWAYYERLFLSHVLLVYNCLYPYELALTTAGDPSSGALLGDALRGALG